MNQFGQWFINYEKQNGEHDERYTSEGILEMDEDYFTVEALKCLIKHRKQVEVLRPR